MEVGYRQLKKNEEHNTPNHYLKKQMEASHLKLLPKAPRINPDADKERAQREMHLSSICRS